MKKIIVFLVVSLFLTPVSAQYLNIKSRYKALTYEELARPVREATQAYNQTMDQINDLVDYIVDVLGNNIDNQLRQEMNQELKRLDKVAEELSETGQIADARDSYNMIYRNVRNEIAMYNNRVAQVREREISGERARTEWNAANLKNNNANSIRIITNPSGYKTKGAENLSVNSITLTPTETILDCSCKNPLAGGWMNISREAHLRVSYVSSAKYKLLKTEGIAFAPDYTYFSYPNQTLRFKLYFPAIPTDAEMLDFIESPESGWKIFGLKIK